MRLNIQRFEGRKEYGRFRKVEGRLYFKLTARLSMTPQEKSVMDKYDMLTYTLAPCSFLHTEKKFNKKEHSHRIINVEMLLEGIETEPVYGEDRIYKFAEFIRELREGCQRLKNALDMLPLFVGESEDEFTSTDAEKELVEIYTGEVEEVHDAGH